MSGNNVVSCQTRGSIVRVTVPRHSGIIIDVKSRTPSLDDSGLDSTDPGRVSAANESAGSDTLTDMDAGRARALILTDRYIIGPPTHHNNQTGDEDDDGDVGTDAEREGRPPQPGIVESRQPSSNPILQRWVRVRGRLYTWRLACHSQCGRVCAARRQNKT